MSDLNERLAELSPEQREKLLRKLKAQKVKAKKQADRKIQVHENDNNEYPLSPAQQRLWLAEQLMPGLPVYNIPIAFRIQGALNVPALEKAILTITERHASLRTHFITRQGEGLQVIDSEWQGQFVVEDLTSFAPEAREEKVAELLDAEAKLPFAMTDNTFFRALLYQLAEDDAVLMLNMHHIISDGWSLGILTNEISTLYQAFAQGEESPLTSLPVQYKDVAVWQIEHANDEPLQKQLAYWQEQLAGELPVLEMPLIAERPSVQQFAGDRQEFSLDPAFVADLKRFAQKEGISLYMVCLAAYKVLLARYSGQEELIVGSPVANRNRVEVENIIGFFVNMVPIRTDLSGNPTFRELVQQIRPLTLDAFGNQELSFDRMVELVADQIEQGSSPIFQTDFTLQNGPIVLELDGLTTTYWPQYSGTAKFDISLEMWEENDGINGLIDYNTGLFAQETVARIVEHFKVLLRGILANPDTPIQHLPLLTDTEFEQIREWNGTAVPDYQPATFNERFEALVEAQPLETAVQHVDATLTYAQLNEQANQIARKLQSLGAEPGKLVGICMPRSLDLIVGIIGILKSGAGYVPIDPDYPFERKEYMLQDAEALAVLTLTSVVDSLPKTQAEIIAVDGQRIELESLDGSNVETAVSPRDTAYVIYTSGSTGKPKGVIIAHQSLVSYAESASEVYGIDNDAKLVQFASISFDISIEEIFCTLISGGTLFLRTDAMLDVFEFLQRCEEWGITAWSLPTAFWHEIVLALKQSTPVPSALKSVFIGGEKVQNERVADWLTVVGNYPRLINSYGPTEATVVATYTDMSNLEVADGQALDVHIGKPWRNVQTYVLSKYLQPVPIGVPGELHIGGIQVAQGYRNRPEKTEQVFIPDPFTAGDDAKLYKTGDSVRYRPDGNLDFIGRVDFQVKIRGFRVEPGGIETVLNQHTAVQETVILPVGGGAAGKRLIAYAVLEEGQSATMEDLHEYLQGKLPDYMVPSGYVILDEFPKTQNGKINRRALPEPSDDQMRGTGTEYVAPETETEKQLAEIWIQVLGINQVGVNDNIFELGGHSLLFARIIAHIQETFNIKLSLDAIFNAPTVARLAAQIDTLQGKTQTTGEQAPTIQIDREAYGVPITIEEDGETREVIGYPLSHAQLRLWFVDQLEADRAHFNIPSAFRMKGNLDIAALEMSLNDLVVRHESLRTIFRANEGDPLQIVREAVAIDCPITDLTTAAEIDREEEMLRLLVAEAKRPFDLRVGPLLRTSIIKMAADEHVLLVNMHHIISDGWSIDVYLSELAAIYKAHLTGKAPEIAPLPVQYIEFAQWHNEFAEGAELEKQLAYWEEKLTGAMPVLELPTDHQRPAVQQNEGDIIFFELDPALTEPLQQLSQQSEASLYMTLMAAYKIMLARYTGQEDIVVGTPTANRHAVELEGLIGFFVNMVVLRSDLSGNPTFRSLLTQLRQTALDAYANEDVPFETLVGRLHPNRDLSYSPIYQVDMSYQNGELGFDFPELDVSLIPHHNGTSKIDLSLELWQREGQLKGYIEFDTALFERATIERMVSHFETLLNGIVANPESPIAQLPLLPADEYQLVVEGWNDTAVSLPEMPLMHHMFEQQVAATPNAIALIAGEQQLTYAQLNARANQLAHHLKAIGLETEQFVGLYLDRSIDMLVAMLATMKAGGVYLPLDPSYPEERLAYMLTDTETKILLTHDGLRDSLPLQIEHTIYLDSEWNQIAESSSENLSVEVTPENLVYVIYTSGSTGKPKGVMIPHRALVNHALAIAREYELTEADNILQFAALSFDVAAEELYPTWLSGATVILRPESILTSFEAFEQFVVEHQITILNLPAAFWQEWVSELERATDAKVPERVRLVVTGSEKVSGEKLNRWLELVPDNVRWLNAYGPTEATITSTIFDPKKSITPIGAAVSIGRPIDNLQVYLLDEQMQPVPVGVAGELHLGGVGLARGYLHRDDLTAEKFVQSPFSMSTADRLYKTGDLARYLPDGNIEFLGRADHQVKIRGFRIELGEIEAVLQAQDGITECVVDVREDGSGNGRLVGYIVANGQSVHQDTLRQKLREQLPDYMVPTDYMVMENLPLTPSGKINRRALPAPDFSAHTSKELVAPRTELERQLVEIWENLLNVKPIGITDNYFELGGQSLLAMRLFAQIKDVTGQKLPLATLFESPTIAELAVAIDHEIKGTQPERKLSNNFKPWVIPIQPKGDKIPFFHMGGSALLYNLAKYLGEDQPMFGVLEQDLDGELPLHITVEDIVPHCIEGIRSVQPEGPYIIGGLCFGAVVSIEVARALKAQGEEVALVVMIDSYAPDAVQAPMPVSPNGESDEPVEDVHIPLYKRGPKVIVRKVKRKVWRKSWRHIHNLYSKIGRPMPYRFRDIEEANTIANDNYKANEYDGDAILFQVSERDDRFVYDENMMGWGKYIHGKTELYQLAGGHLSVYDEPYVQGLGQQIRECIDQLNLEQ